MKRPLLVGAADPRQANAVGRCLLTPHGQPADGEKMRTMRVRIVQIAATRDITGREQLYALTDKGDVWLHNEHEWSWDKLPPLPTDDNAAVEHDAT